MSGRLKLRRGLVVAADPLEVEVEGERRRAWADEVLLGPMREGDEVVVNVAALDLDLGSGGFDVVHVNLSRGLDGGGVEGQHVIKLNYTSLQHPVAPVEEAAQAAGGGDDALVSRARRGKATHHSVPVLVLPLHGHLAPAAWALAQVAPGSRVGYVQTAGGALPGSLSRDVTTLRERSLLCGHITAAPAYGGEAEALSTFGAIDAAVCGLGWEAVLVGPGPGIIGSETEYGHGGVEAVNSAHAALSLRLPTLVSPRLSSSDPRERHRGLSHHTRTVLGLLLGGVEVVMPEPGSVPPAVPSESAGAAGSGDAATEEGGAAAGSGENVDAVTAAEQLREACGDRHRLVSAAADLNGYAAAGLPARTMGRSLAQDQLFFAAPLAAGTALAGAALRGKG